MKTVMAFGAFDIVHPGHLYYLKEARKHGDTLIVVVARDETIKKAKGTEPKFHQQDRLEFMRQLRLVDKAVLGNPEDYLKVIEEHKPDILCLGYDQRAMTDDLNAKLAKRGLHPGIIRIAPYKQDIYKSGKLKERL
ncbi:TPA: FAD synthase [Candidatus Woesearchaeota archaeon]|nr:FAD synthase [Candidatus Woesearchaeota archaeon]HII68334.1 FAD synthase [Candidatus Woesearchaeota archaeon]